MNSGSSEKKKKEQALREVSGILHADARLKCQTLVRAFCTSVWHLSMGYSRANAWHFSEGELPNFLFFAIQLDQLIIYLLLRLAVLYLIEYSKNKKFVPLLEMLL